MTAADTNTAAPMGYTHDADHSGWFTRAERWLDERGKPAWIGAIVLGFIAFWPIGLGLLFYMLFFKKSGSGHYASRRQRRMKRGMAMMQGSSGNRAFDSYRTETLRRLEEEQDNFESFLERLRDAKDKAEFDQFMDERATAAKGYDNDQADDDSETARTAG